MTPCLYQRPCGIPKDSPKGRQAYAAYMDLRQQPVAAWVAEVLSMGHFTTVSRAMRFYDDPGGDWKSAKDQILRFIGWYPETKT